MATAFSDILSEFKELESTSVKNLLGKLLYFIVLKHREDLLSVSDIDCEQRKEKGIESLYQALNPKDENNKKHTYKGEKKIKDSVTGVEKVIKDADLNYKKFISIITEVKASLSFMLIKYISECKQCYMNERKFNDETTILEQICRYSEKNITMPLAPCIFKLNDVFNSENLIKGSYGEVYTNLNNKIKTYFKNKDDSYPERQLGVIIDAYIKFVKTIAILSTSMIYEKKSGINSQFFFGIIRQINAMLKANGSEIDEEFIINLKAYANANKVAKKKSTKDENNQSESDNEDGETKKKPKAKKATKSEKSGKKETTKKTNGKGKKSGKKETKSPKKEQVSDEDEDDNQLDDENDVNDLLGDQWNDTAKYSSDENNENSD